MRSWNVGDVPVRKQNSVLILDGDAAGVALICQSLMAVLHRRYVCRVVSTLAEAVWAVEDQSPDVILISLGERGEGERERFLFRKLRQLLPGTPIIVYSEYDDPDLGEALIRDGAQDYISTQMIAVPGFMARIIQHAVQRERTRHELQEVNRELSQQQGRLAKTTEQLEEARLSLVDAERMRTMGRLAAGVAHEVKNPLAIIRVGLDYMTNRLPEQNKVDEKIFARMMRAIERADGIINGLLDFSAPKPLARKLSIVENIVYDAFTLTEHTMIKHDVSFTLNLPKTDVPRILADYENCVQVLVNLFLNACHAIGRRGNIEVAVRVCSRWEAQLETSRQAEGADPVLELKVLDDGPGIPSSVFPKLFEPFFTTKEREGTGLGLCVSRMIMQMHGGELQAENRDEGGAAFQVVWPLQISTTDTETLMVRGG